MLIIEVIPTLVILPRSVIGIELYVSVLEVSLRKGTAHKGSCRGEGGDIWPAQRASGK